MPFGAYVRGSSRRGCGVQQDKRVIAFKNGKSYAVPGDVALSDDDATKVTAFPVSSAMYLILHRTRPRCQKSVRP